MRNDWTIDQGWRDYGPQEHQTWDKLYQRQTALLPNRACAPFLRGLDALDLGQGGIPNFEQVNIELVKLTGWRVVAVPGLVPDDVFFEHLANRRFPAGRFIRNPDRLDYLQEPDVFHDLFGHIPMLTDPIFADYMAAYGQGGLRAKGRGQLHHLARLYWYTVEFGLLAADGGLRIYGAGIVSSHSETTYALESATPSRLSFDLETVMRTPYRIDDLQQIYFVVPSLRDLLDATLEDFGSVYDRLSHLTDLTMAQGFAAPNP